VYTLRGRRYKWTLDNDVRDAYIFEVGSDVVNKAVRALRKASIMRHKDEWTKYFDFVSRQPYFPRENGVLILAARELRDGTPLAWLFCLAKSVPSRIAEGLTPAGEAEVQVAFGRYTILAVLNGKKIVGAKIGSEGGAICFRYVVPLDYFLYSYEYCVRNGNRCTTFPYEESEDLMRLISSYA